MNRALIIIPFVLLAGCQLLLPDLDAVDGDTGSNLALNGESCAADGDCESEHCQNDICCNQGSVCCEESSVCSGNMACDTAHHECFEECSYEDTEYDHSCAEGYHCDANECFEDIAVGGCDEDSDCVSNLCINDYCCEHAGLCCFDDDDCPELFDGCATDNTYTCVFSAFNLPDTGQTECYDSGGNSTECSDIQSNMDYYGQDGHYEGPARSYDTTETEWIYDETTGLSWRTGGGFPADWETAVSQCAASTVGEKTWRLPTRMELVTVLDLSNESNGADPAFQFGYTDLVWSATEFAGSEGATAWAVNFDTGGVIRVGKEDSGLKAVCVSED